MTYRMETVKKLFPMINGIFTYINYEFPAELTITNAALDVIFLTNWGLRTVAPVVLELHQEGEQLTSAELFQLSQLILVMYKSKWDRLVDVAQAEYDPIHNYSDEYHEEISENISGERTRTPDISVANNESVATDTVVTDGGSERIVTSEEETATRTNNLSEAVQSNESNNLFGFNSFDAVGSDTGASDMNRANTGTVSDSKDRSGESTRYGGLTHTTDDDRVTTGTKRTTGTESEESASDRSRTRDFTHLGNIGNLTTQQLLTQEIELWRWKLIDVVLNDVKDFLTLPLYA